MKLQALLPLALTAAAVASTAAPARAAWYEGMYNGELKPGTISVMQDGIETLFAEHVAPVVSNLPTTAAVGDMVAATAETAGVQVALRTGSGFATFAVPALAPATIAGAVALTGGAIAYALAAHFLDPDKGKTHPTDVPGRFDPGQGSGAGAFVVQDQGQASGQEWYDAHYAANPAYFGAEGRFWSTGNYGPEGFVADAEQQIANGQTNIHRVGGLYALDPSQLTWETASGQSNTWSAGAHLVGASPAGPISHATGTVDPNPVGLAAGQVYTVVTGIGSAQRDHDRSNWDMWQTSISSTFVAKPLTPANVGDWANPGTDQATKDRIRQAVDPWPGAFGGPAAPAANPTGNTPQDPPVLYQNPNTGAWELSPHGLPTGDNGRPTAAAPKAYNPTTGETEDYDPNASPEPTATPTSTPSGSPTSTPSGSPTSSPSGGPSASPSPGSSASPGSSTQNINVTVNFPTPSAPPSDPFSRLLDGVKTKWPFDMIGDLGNVGQDQDLTFTAWKGRQYGGKDVEKSFSLNWLKPGFSAVFTLAGIGLCILAILWI